MTFEYTQEISANLERAEQSIQAAKELKGKGGFNIVKTESKNEKFKRIATGRVRNVIKKIEYIGKLSSPNYEYTDDEIEKIFSALQEALDNVKALFSSRKQEKKEFEL